MKSKLGILIKKELLLSFGMRNPKKEPNPIRFFLIPLFLLAIGPTIWLYVMVLKGAIEIFTMINQLPSLYLLILISVQMLLFFTGLPSLMGRFYGNKDNDILIPMPIRTTDILISRIVPVFAIQVITALFFVIPTVIVSILETKLKASSILAFLVGSVASIIFPTAIAAVAVLLLMRFTSFGKHRDKWKTVGLFLILALSIGIQVLAQSQTAANFNQNFVLRLLTDNQALINMFGTIFLPARWTALAMSQRGYGVFLYTGMNLALTIQCLFLVYYIGTKVYLQGILSGQEMMKAKPKKVQELRTASAKPIVSMITNEFRIILRTPVYALNVLSTPLLMSVIWLIPILANREVGVQISSLLKQVPWDRIPTDIVVAIPVLAGAVIGLILSVVTETSTSISREGEAFWIHRVLPIRVRDEVIARSAVSMIIVVVSAAVMSVIGWFLFKYPIRVAPLIALSAVFASLPLTLAGLAIDAKRPKLYWNDENEAVKQNLNTFFSMLCVVAYGFLLWGVGKILFQSFPDFAQFLRWGLFLFFAINAILTVGLFILAKKTMKDTFRSFEG